MWRTTDALNARITLKHSSASSKHVFWLQKVSSAWLGKVGAKDINAYLFASSDIEEHPFVDESVEINPMGLNERIEIAALDHGCPFKVLPTTVDDFKMTERL